MEDQNKPVKVFIGWDSREDIAYQVAKQSIEMHSTIPVDIQPLKQKELRRDGWYTREVDKLASTEFTFTRFLLPELCNFEGWALFIDCDFVFKNDIKELFDQIDDNYALMCAQHDYTPKEGSIKMDGQVQQQYPRKNWSSMMLINCGHPSNHVVTKSFVNNEALTGAYLHRFSWLKDEQIGEISHEWNWLVGWYTEPEDGTPKALHYTEGGPWFEEYKDCEYAKDWYQIQMHCHQKMIKKLEEKIVQLHNRDVTVDDLSYTDQKKNLIKKFLQTTIDPHENVYKGSHKQLERLKEREMGIKVAAIALHPEDNYKKLLESKGRIYDPYLEDFILGSGGQIGSWNYKDQNDTTLIIRGLGGKSQKALKMCMANEREFFAIDTGYMQPGRKKEYHRVTRNGLQNTGPLIEREGDRLQKLKWKPQPIKTGRKILICPPSQKVMKFYNEDVESWIANTLNEIKKYTDRPIEIRNKPSRTERVTNKTIWQALADDVHCLVTYNSIAATEAFLFGVPAIALAPNAATSVCNTKLKDIENLNVPTSVLQYQLATHLSYCQFTSKELRDGTAWSILNESG